VSSGELVKGTFGISYTDEAHIMGILRDGLYTDKVLAVLREYSSNAWDAHRDAGTPDKPIKVHIPTALEPKLRIRDWGPGLSEDDVFAVYTQYGKSTKRGTDNAVGMLGIGSKSGFAYSESFTVTSWHGGTKKIYIAALDDSDRGEMNMLHEEPCADDETGVEIQIPVRPQDIWEFQNKARELFSYFDPQPHINVTLESFERHTMKSGFVSDDAHQWVALMGCVPYKVDPHKLREELSEAGVWLSMDRLKGALYFDIGEVRISANREELKYTEPTRQRIADKAKALFEEYIEEAIKALKDTSTSAWDRRVKASFMKGNLGLTVPADYAEWTRDKVSLWGRSHPLRVDPPKSFTLHREGSATTSIPVTESHFLILRDDPRASGNFDYPQWKTTLIRPADGFTAEQARTELLGFLDDSNLTGINICNISSYSYTKSHRGSRTQNIKHRVKSFRLLCAPSTLYTMTSSDWDIVDREPSDDDVFLIISRFQAHRYSGFQAHYTQDKKLATWLGLEMPEIYGYKTTSKKPLTKADCKGTHYSEWRKTFFADKLTRFWREMSGRILWRDALDSQDFSLRPHLWRKEKGGVDLHKILQDELGDKHPLTRMFSLWITAHEKTKRLRRKDIFALKHWRELTPLPKGRRTAPQKALEDFYRDYPLFKVSDLRVLKGEDTLAWLEYVKLIDRDRENTK
jgi:hypothetical protein